MCGQCQRLPAIRTQTPASTSLPSHYALIILTFGAIQSKQDSVITKPEIEKLREIHDYSYNSALNISGYRAPNDIMIDK